MNQLKKISMIFILLAITSCKFNPYGSALHSQSTTKCDRLIESTAKANCYENVNESYSNIREREDEKKRKDNEKLDFRPKKEPPLSDDN